MSIRGLRMLAVSLLAGAAFWAGVFGIVSCNDDDRVPAETPVIQEDDPRWDCRTMGNRVCGGER